MASHSGTSGVYSKQQALELLFDEGEDIFSDSSTDPDSDKEEIDESHIIQTYHNDCEPSELESLLYVDPEVNDDLEYYCPEEVKENNPVMVNRVVNENIQHHNAVPLQDGTSNTAKTVKSMQTQKFYKKKPVRVQTAGPSRVLSAKKPEIKRLPGKTKTRNFRNEHLEWKHFEQQENNSNLSKAFVGRPAGPSRVACQAVSVLDHFQLFVPENMWKEWSDETNRYAQECRLQTPSKMSWTDTVPEEIQAYMGMCVAMGIINLPSVEDYFSTEPILSHPWFPSIMSRDRFKLIDRYFHVCNDSEFPRTDKLAKVRSIINHFSKIFPQHWNLHQQICIDEQLIGSRNRIGFIQYLPKKPTKFGVKVWVLADSVMPYVTNFQVYTGRDERTAEHGLANRVVDDLMAKHIGLNHVLYTDNFYSNPLKFLDLETKDTFCVGTVRQNRIGMPNLMRNNKLEKGKNLFMKCGNLTAVQWKDKRDVFALSTCHGNKVNNVEPFKPELICDYNNHMNGVDRNDQLLSYYTMNRACKKWWKKVYWRLFEMAIVNSFIIYKYKSVSIQRDLHKRFRLKLAYNLTQPLLDLRINDNVVQGPGRKSLPIARLQGKHFSSGGIKGSKRGRCKVCAKLKNVNGKCKDTKTSNVCNTCPDKPFLCQGLCFEKYHRYTNI